MLTERVSFLNSIFVKITEDDIGIAKKVRLLLNDEMVRLYSTYVCRLYSILLCLRIIYYTCYVDVLKLSV